MCSLCSLVLGLVLVLICDYNRMGGGFVIIIFFITFFIIFFLHVFIFIFRLALDG